MSDTTTPKTQPLSPTTGEPMSAISRRAKGALWSLIVMDAAGTIALVISYAYLWGLNVNNGWAPPGASLTGAETDNNLPSTAPTGSFAVEWPFWAILGMVILATLAMWFGYKELGRGNRAGMLVGSTVALVISVVTLVAQWIQITNLPFGPDEGAYASAVILLLSSNIFNLLIVIFLLLGMVNRTRKRLITPTVSYQAKMMSYWMVWLCIAFLLGAVCTTFMVESPNLDPITFGTFTISS